MKSVLRDTTGSVEPMNFSDEEIVSYIYHQVSRDSY